jgi:glutamate dehydrogenase
LLRAWYRYLRQTGVTYGMPTAVAALSKHSGVTRAIVSLFNAAHDPAFTGDRDKESAKFIKSIETGLAAVSAIDEDRILRRYMGVVRATLRTNAFAPAGAEALAFKLDSAKVPGLPRLCLGAKCSFIRRGSRASICALVLWRAAGCAGPTAR